MTTKEITTHESKFGFHPCDRETYMKLKKLNHWFFQAQQRAARWNRWARKDKQNRVIRRFIRNDKGQKIGCKIVGPMPEPQNIENPFCSFGEKNSYYLTLSFPKYGCSRTAQTHWLNKGQGDLKVEWGMLGPVAEYGEKYCYYLTGLYVDSFGIDRDYHNAKRPVAMKNVQPLKNSVEEIDALYEKVLEWQKNL